jgi:ABC-type glutathione transport system ATPase component
MAQRVCLARALMHRSKLLIAAEPTAGLDVTIQRQGLDLMQSLARECGTAQLIITADLGIVAQYCDKIAVKRSGRILELNSTPGIFACPIHPYSRQLLDAVRLRGRPRGRFGRPAEAAVAVPRGGDEIACVDRDVHPSHGGGKIGGEKTHDGGDLCGLERRHGHGLRHQRRLCSGVSGAREL